MKEHDSLLVGCAISLLSSVIATLGYAVQKMGHEKALSAKEHYIKEPKWIIGFMLIVISVPIYSLSLVFASQTAMSMVPTLSIIFVMFWSWLLLNEKLTKYELYAIAFLAPGTIVIILSCNVTETHIGSNAFKDYIFSNQSVLFLSVIAVLFMIGGAVSMHIIRTHERMEYSNVPQSENPRDTLTSSARSEGHATSDVLSYRWNVVPLIYFPWFAGMFCCLASTLIKSWFINFKERARHHHDLFGKFGDPQGVVLLINIGILTFASFYLINKALLHFEPIYVLPLEKVSLLINNLL